MAKIEETLNEVLLPFGTSYVNLITSSVYSVEVPPAFIVNFFKGQVWFGSPELGVGTAIIC